MMLSELLRQTALRFEQAAQVVLEQWSPECGCSRPGMKPQCEACPCLSLFEQRVLKQIQSMADEDTLISPGIQHQGHEANIYISSSSL